MNAWLIEAAWKVKGEPVYLVAADLPSSANKKFEWIARAHNSAIRFSRKEDAERAIDALREACPDLFPTIVPMPTATEHSWAGGDRLAAE